MYKKEKKIIKIKGDKKTVEYKICNPRKLPLTIQHLHPYWYQAIKNVNSYAKRRDFAESHKLFSDDRLRKGYELYKNKKILESTITTDNGGDVLATVESEDGKKTYRVIVKSFVPQELPQNLPQREEYIANLRIMCNCDDHIIGRYKDNSSVICKHGACVLWDLIFNWKAPRFLVLPEQKMLGYKKSEIEEIEVRIESIPLIHFTQYINVLLLKNYRNMKAACGISIHRISNDTHEELGKAQWLTYVDTKNVIRLIRGLVTVLNKMTDKDEKYEFGQKALTTKKQTPRWITWPPREVALLRRYYPDRGTNIPDLRTHHTPLAIRLKAHKLKIRHYNKNNNKYK